MDDRNEHVSRRDVLRYLGSGAATIAGASVLSASGVAAATRPGDGADPVVRWIVRHAEPLRTLDPDAPLGDLRALAPRLARAAVVGLGAPYGAHEPFVLRQRVVRLLVEQLGFRAVAFEEDWTKGIQLDDYLLTGAGDPRALLADAGLPWQTQEMLDLLAWMRSFNRRNPGDPVRLVGVDVVGVRALAYDAVADYVALVAPDLSDDLAAHWGPLRPSGAIGDHVRWYRSQPDKQPFIDHARQAYELVAGLPAADGHDLALRHARVIVGFYEYFASNQVGVRDSYMAENVSWWHEHRGDKVVYWASNVHTAVADPLTIHWGDFPASVQTSAGGHLRTRYGRRYASIGVTFRHGTVNAGFPLATYAVPEPRSDFLEATLGAADHGTYLLDLRGARPRPVRAWLTSPLRSHAIGPFYDPAHDADYAMSGGTPADWFDLVVHTQLATPTQLMA